MSSRRRRLAEYPYSDPFGGDRLSNKYEETTVHEVLDLHGHNKEKAMRAVTFFFDSIRSKNKYLRERNHIYVVEIITGIGHHSPHGMCYQDSDLSLTH